MRMSIVDLQCFGSFPLPFVSLPRYARCMQIRDLGEFGLIERISRLLPPYAKDVVAGVGEDVAVVETQGDCYQLFTCDIQIEGTHFYPSVSPYCLGRKAAAVNLSDIGAKGGEPLHFLVSLALRSECQVKWVEEFYVGLCEEASRYGADIAGGNLSHINGPQVIDLFLMGKVKKDRILLRSGAKPGDVVMVTGHLGNAKGGLLLEKRSIDGICPEMAKFLLRAWQVPTPRVKEGQVIAQSRKATAMIDISDGLAQDLLHICDASGVGVEVWANRIPVSPALEGLARILNVPVWRLALNGGEDYELCLTAPEEEAQELAREVKKATGTLLSVVGRILPLEEGTWLIMPDGERRPLGSRGWDHFMEVWDGRERA